MKSFEYAKMCSKIAATLEDSLPASNEDLDPTDQPSFSDSEDQPSFPDSEDQPSFPDSEDQPSFSDPEHGPSEKKA
jgi:hypothetical protein